MKNHITYERVMLTVIAGLLMMNFVKQSPYQDEELKSKLPSSFASWHGVNQNYAVVPMNSDGAIEVIIKGSTHAIDVNVAGVDTKDKLNINLSSTDMWALSNAGTLEVKVK